MTARGFFSSIARMLTCGEEDSPEDEV
jgi:Dullard-like phosphatase family protein